MKKILYILSCIVVSISKNAQISSSKHESVLTMTEGAPVYPGGEVEMMKFLVKNLRYPSYSEDSLMFNSLCVVSFSIDSIGKVQGMIILKSLGKQFDKRFFVQ